MAEEMTIGQLAAAAGVSVETVRYYQRRGILAVPPRPAGRIARYPAGELRRLLFIKRAQTLGFSLDDVHALLALDDGSSCAVARGIGERKLAEIREHIRRLRALEAGLQSLVELCTRRGRRVRCPLIDALMRADEPQ